MSASHPASVTSSDSPGFVASRQARSGVSAMRAGLLISSEFMPVSLLAPMVTDVNALMLGAALRWAAESCTVDCEGLAVVFGR